MIIDVRFPFTKECNNYKNCHFPNHKGRSRRDEMIVAANACPCLRTVLSLLRVSIASDGHHTGTKSSVLVLSIIRSAAGGDLHRNACNMKSSSALLQTDLFKTDPRIKLLAAKIKKEKFKPDALIEILHTAQSSYGYLPMNVLQYVARALRLPPSRVYSTVTFYHFFSLKSKGEHTCLVCTGTACYVKGAQAILNEIESKMGLKAGEVSTDNKLGVQVARCIGACGLAPAVVIDDEVQAKVSAGDIVNTIIDKIGA